MQLTPGLARSTFSCLHTDSRSSAGSYQCCRSQHRTRTAQMRATSAAAAVTQESTEHASQQIPRNISPVATATSQQQRPAWARHRRRQPYKQRITHVQDGSSNSKVSAAPSFTPQQHHEPRATLLYIPRGFESQAAAAASTHGLLLQDSSSAAGSAMAVQTGLAPAQQQQQQQEGLAQVEQHPRLPQQRQQLPSSRNVSEQRIGRISASNRSMEQQHSHKQMLNGMASVQQQQQVKVAPYSSKVKQQQRRRQRVQRETSSAVLMADEQKVRQVAAATVESPAAETAAVAPAGLQTEAPVQAAADVAPQTAAAAPAAVNIAPMIAAEGGTALQEAAATGITPNTAPTAAAAAAGVQIPTAAPATAPAPVNSNAAPEATATAAIADVANPSTPAAAALAPSKWQLAVNKRLQTAVNSPAMASVRQARLNRLQHRARRTQPSISSSSGSSRGSSGSSTNESSMSLKPGEFSTSSAASPQTAAAAAGGGGQEVLLQQYRDAVESGQGLSATAEADLCDMYQEHLQLQDHLRSAHEQPAAAAAAAMLVDAAQIQQRGLAAQQLLLQAYEPLIINRSRRAAALNASVDPRELRDAAARAVLTAAAKFDRQKAGGSVRLASLAAVYIKTAVRDVLREYQSVPVVLPAEVVELRHKLTKLQQQLTVEAAGLQPTTTQLAAAAGLPVNKVMQVLQATSMQASGFADADDADDAGAATGGGVDLLQLDVTQSADDLNYIAGAVKHARQGLKEEQQAAEESKSLAALMQQSILSLEPKDRTLIALKLGLVDPSTVAAAAATSVTSQSVAELSRHDANLQSGRPVKRRERISDRIPVISTDTLLQKLESVESLEDYDTQAGLSVAELSRIFNMPRQRGHQLFQGVVQQLRERLRNAASSDAELALLLAAARGSCRKQHKKEATFTNAYGRQKAGYDVPVCCRTPTFLSEALWQTYSTARQLLAAAAADTAQNSSSLSRAASIIMDKGSHRCSPGSSSRRQRCSSCRVNCRSNSTSSTLSC